MGAFLLKLVQNLFATEISRFVQEKDYAGSGAVHGRLNVADYAATDRVALPGELLCASCRQWGRLHYPWPV